MDNLKMERLCKATGVQCVKVLRWGVGLDVALAMDTLGKLHRSTLSSQTRRLSLALLLRQVSRNDLVATSTHGQRLGRRGSSTVKFVRDSRKEAGLILCRRRRRLGAVGSTDHGGDSF